MRAIQTNATTITSHGRTDRRREAARLTEGEIRRIQRSRRRIDDLAREYGLSRWTVSALRVGKL